MSDERKNESDERKKEDEEEEIPLREIKIQGLNKVGEKSTASKKCWVVIQGMDTPYVKQKIWGARRPT